MSLRILVVDDSAVFRRLIKQALEGIAGVEVVGSCHNGRAGLQRIQADPPDLVTLDIEMPEMNGLEVLQEMRRKGIETGAIVLSALGARARELTIRALELGAFDFLTKPECATAEESLAVLRDQLAPLVAAAAHRKQVRSLLRGERGDAAAPVDGNKALPQASAGPREPATAQPAGDPALIPARGTATPADTLGDAALRMHRITGRVKPAMVLIGVSTGGPNALARIIPQLPAGLSVPVLIVQHMPPLFTQNLADHLNSCSALRVKEAENGEIALAGHVYIAPGGSQMKLAAGPQGAVLMRITGDPPENNCRPSVDYLFRSAAVTFPGRSVAVILTGMGSDGTLGLRLLKAGGCLSIAQDEASCVVFGMPKEAIQAGVVDLVAPLDSIAGKIAKAVL